jgi:hypothetical protein
MLTARRLVADRVRGDFFARKLMRTQDIGEVAQTLNLHPTQASNMLFANFSAFYGLRAELRKVVLGHMMPQLPVLTNRLVLEVPGPLPAELVRSEGRRRLRELGEYYARRGTRFVLLAPPLVGSAIPTDLQAAAAEAGVEFHAAFVPGQFSESYFSDGWHLNEAGAAVYTPELARTLRAAWRMPAGQ